MLLSLLVSTSFAASYPAKTMPSPCANTGCPTLTIPDPITIVPDPNFVSVGDEKDAGILLNTLPSNYASLATNSSYVVTTTNGSGVTVPLSTHFDGTLNGLPVDFYMARSSDKKSALLYGTIDRKNSGSSQYFVAYLSSTSSSTWSLSGTIYEVAFGATWSLFSLSGTVNYSCWGGTGAPACEIGRAHV